MLLLVAFFTTGSFCGESDAKQPATAPATTPAANPAAQVVNNKNADIPDLPKLIADVNGADVAARNMAAGALLKSLEEQIKQNEKPYAKTLLVEVSASDAAVQEAGKVKFATIVSNLRKANQKVFDELFSKLNAADPKEREGNRATFIGLVNAAVESDLIDKYIEDLASADPGVTAEATKRLQEFGAAAATDLARAVDDERLQVKKSSAEILKSMGPAAREAAGDLSFMLDSEDKGTRRLAASVLEALGPDATDAVDDLIGYLSSDEKPLRRTAAGILKKIGPAGWAKMDPKDSESATTDLIELLTDDDKHIRNQAAEVLMVLGAAAKSGIEELVDIIEDENNDPDSRERAAAILGAMGAEAKAAVPDLKKVNTEEGALKEAINAALKLIDK